MHHNKWKTKGCLEIESHMLWRHQLFITSSALAVRRLPDLAMRMRVQRCSIASMHVDNLTG